MKNKFVVCLLGRFHAFEYIAALAQSRLLHTFVTSYPEKFLGQFVDTKQFVLSGWPILELINRFRRFLLTPRTVNNGLCFLIGWRASLAVTDSRVGTYVQWLGTGERWVKRANDLGLTTIVVCGNFHPSEQQAQIQKARAYQLSLLGSSDSPSADELSWFRSEKSNPVRQACRELELCSFVQVVSTPARDSFLREGFSPERIVCVNTGVDLKYFRPGDLSSFPYSQRVRVVFVGSGSFRKGFVEFCLLAEKCPEMDFYHIGSIDSEVQTLLSEAGSLNKPNLFLKGRLSRFKVSEFLRSCEALVLPSWEEGLAAVLLQALASGCLVLATRESGFSDLVPVDLQAELVLERHNVSEMATKLRAALDNPARVVGMRHTLLGHVTDNHSWQVYQSRILEEYTGRGII